MTNFFIIGHILPLAIGHHAGNESKSSWGWFLNLLKAKFPLKEDIIVLLDRDKGGREAMRYVWHDFNFYHFFLFFFVVIHLMMRALLDALFISLKMFSRSMGKMLLCHSCSVHKQRHLICFISNLQILQMSE